MTPEQYATLKQLCQSEDAEVLIKVSDLRELVQAVQMLSAEAALSRRIIKGINLYNGTEDSGKAMALWQSSIGANMADKEK